MVLVRGLVFVGIMVYTGCWFRDLLVTGCLLLRLCCCLLFVILVNCVLILAWVCWWLCLLLRLVWLLRVC